MFVKAIFDEPTERTDWPSSQLNVNVNEDEIGTQVKQQLQDGTVGAVHVSCCEFGLVFFQNCRTSSTAVGLFVPDLFVYSTLLSGGGGGGGGWRNISV